jgi:hypothetical protein
MKRLGKVLFGVLCMILLFTFSHAGEIKPDYVVPEKKSKIAWDATTTYINHTKIEHPEAVGYFVYICNEEDNKCLKKESMKKERKFRIPINTNPIRKTNYPLPLLEKGKYFVGVRAVLYKDKKLGAYVNESTISWSRNQACTNNKPFCLKVKK